VHRAALSATDKSNHPFSCGNHIYRAKTDRYSKILRNCGIFRVENKDSVGEDRAAPAGLFGPIIETPESANRPHRGELPRISIETQGKGIIILCSLDGFGEP
jgi:hypothetical protein